MDFHRVIIFVEKPDKPDKEEHNINTDLPIWSSKTNTRPHKHTNKSVKIAIKESISRQKGVDD